MLSEVKHRNWWRRRTSLEKCLLLVSALALMALIAFVSVLSLVLLTNQRSEKLKTITATHSALASNISNIEATPTIVKADNKKMKRSVDLKLNNTCLTIECNYTATEVLRKMKTEIEPCEDFYQFACGNFINETQIPDGKEHINTYSIESDKLREQLKTVIVEERSDSEPRYLRMPNAYYKACMNETLIESLGTKPMQQLSVALGGWPVVVGSSWNSNNTWTWQEAVKNFRHLGFNPDLILSFEVIMDPKNNTRNIINLDQSSHLFNREYLIRGINDTLMKSYHNIMVDVAILFGAKKENASNELKDSLQFEIDLANISLPSEKRRDSNDLYNLRSIKEMQDSYPYVQWLDYINNLLPENITIDENEIINLSVPRFFEDLGKLLNRTDKRTLANYMMGRVHASSLPFLTDDFIRKQIKSFRGLRGSRKGKARWEKCVDEAASLGYAMGSLYVRKYFKKDFKGDALEMVNNIRGTFSQILDKVAWMDDDTKQEANKKLMSMTTYIGYADELLDTDKLEKFYNKLKIDPDKYFESYLNLNAFEMDYSFSFLGLPENKTDGKKQSVPYIANALYSTVYNSIDFPSGIWQGHFYNSQRPKYMNYGAIGFIISHEITHGFDDEGSQFDGNGNLVNWWQSDTKSKFVEKAKCIIEQYGNYTEKQTGRNLKGINTQGENIADNAGVKISYMAYNQWAAKNGQEPRLPNLDYSPQQMFWISYAQSFCSKYKTEYLEDFITTEFHSPNELRVLGPLSNMRDFSRDFKCPEGSPMNPVHKCEIW